MQNINVSASTQRCNWEIHVTLHVFRNVLGQRYNRKKIGHFSTYCHCCQFYAFRDAYGEQNYTPDSYVAFTTSSYLMWPRSVRTAPTHCELCMARQCLRMWHWIGPCLVCRTIHCVLIFPYRVPYYIIQWFNAFGEPIWYDTLFRFIVSYHIIHCSMPTWWKNVMCILWNVRLL